MRAYIPDTPFATYVHTQVRRTRISTKLLTRKKTGLEKNGEQSVGRRGEGDAARERHHRGGGYEKRGWYVARRNGAGTRERERVMVEDGASTGQGEGR